MTIEIDAARVGTISSAMREMARQRAEKAKEYIESGHVENAGFYAAWAATYGNCVLEIDKDAL